MGDAINEMCEKFGIDKESVDAVGFHGKTLDHNPISRAKVLGNKAYTLQMGSGEMLADMVGIRVIYDFRSAFILNGKEGAPLVGTHNANIAKIEGDGVYFNGGNTSNFAVIKGGEVVFKTDVGPFNEYIDMYVRKKLNKTFDENGEFGKKGKLNRTLLQKLYEVAKDFYELEGEKSGDPQYYKSSEILRYLEECGVAVFDVVYTLEYWSAYLAVRGLIKSGVDFFEVKLFGGGWKNPVIRNVFVELLNGNGEILESDRVIFDKFYAKNRKIEVNDSKFGQFMEARLMGDLARYKLEGWKWDDGIECGVIANPCEGRVNYLDVVNVATKGWKI